MSRVSLRTKEPGCELVVGIDPPLQCWFVQYYEPEPEDPEEEHGPAVWKMQITRWEVVEYIDQYGDSSCPLVKKVRDKVVMDLDPKEALAEIVK
jgi:hypothetical protein